MATDRFAYLLRRAYSPSQLRVVTALQSGQLLFHECSPTKSRWWLSDGTQVDARTAHIVTADPNIIGVDALFPDVPAQTWRWAAASRMPRRKRCAECGVHWADPPSSLCPGCEAYREHQS